VSVTRPVGVLALQGAFAAHAAALEGEGLATREVRRCAQLAGLSGLVVPGGESGAILNLMGDEPWLEALRRFHADGGALFGTCAGAILLARDVIPRQPALGLLDVTIERNAYGRQRESFEVALRVAGVGAPITGVFIRAPCISRVGRGVDVLAEHEGNPVLVRQGRLLAATFHPELSGAGDVHRLFAALCDPASTNTAQPGPARGRPEGATPRRPAHAGGNAGDVGPRPVV
jgi:5'-phosphate synthase pdxT subunit